VGKSIQLKLAALVHLFATCIVVAYAADAKEIASGIESIPLGSIRWVAGVSFCFGSVATIIKVAKRDVAVRNLPLEIAKDLVSSVAAGVLVFAFTSMIGLSMWPQFILIMMAGFGGTQVLDIALAKGFFPWLNGVLGRISGTPAGKDTGTTP
jgi:hypothetical protein